MLYLIFGKTTLFNGNSADNVRRILISVVILSMGILLRLRGSPDVPKIQFAPSPVSLSVRKSKGSATVEQTSLRDFVQSKLPSLCLPFIPAWWLFK